MTDNISVVKRKLNDAITQLCEVSWMFSKHPGRDFTRSRKLPFRKVISFLLSMEGGTLANEMLKHFGCSAEIAFFSAYDLLQRTYIDAGLVGDHKSNERGILCSMVDRSPIETALLIADRGYENCKKSLPDSSCITSPS